MMRAPRLPPDGSAREVDDDAFVDAAAWDSARNVEDGAGTAVGPGP